MNGVATTIATTTTTATQRHQADRREGGSSPSSNQSISFLRHVRHRIEVMAHGSTIPATASSGRAYPIPRRPCYTSDSRTAVQSRSNGDPEVRVLGGSIKEGR